MSSRIVPECALAPVNSLQVHREKLQGVFKDK